jgi:NADH-quinone oxidoreductase subunit M
VVIYSWDTIRYQTKLYMMALLALETTTMGVFISIDLILFFVFWELMLIPSYFLIKLWGGGAERHYAALKYVLYTLLGSVFMLVGIALLNINYHTYATLHHMDQAYSFDLLELLAIPIPLPQQILIFWLMFMGFAFKAPVFPFHTWLPDALLEGPIAMAVVLAGIKLGTFGFMRFSIPLLPEASKSPTVVIIMMGLGLAAIIYGAINALMQPDFRRLLAYSSISHLGFIVVGLFALNYQGLQGSLLTMINLGFSTAGLFFIAGFLQSRQQTTHLSAFGVFPVDRTRVDRLAWHEWFRRRVSDFDGRLQGVLGVWSHRRHRRHHRRGVFSVVLRACDPRTGRQGRPRIDRRPASP